MKDKKLLSAECLIDLIENKRFGVEYQPIVSCRSQEIYAYESLARFYTADNKAIRPDLVYESLHTSPLSLFQVEYQQKKLQLSYAINGHDIFVNLDQDSYFSSGIIDQNNPFLKLFKEFQKSTVVVELIENSEINDAIMSLAMIDNLAKNNIPTAIDDVCNPQSMISTSVIQLVDYIKLDKFVIKNKNNRNFMLLVKSIIDYAHSTNKEVILEGVETAEDLRLATQLKCDFVQGFYYRDRFKNVS
ncbi:EAL domain-containing protein [Colwellia psychrerythraea]|uniref:Diguanylate phosphodiesterase n=1 Tax=Colwellia psychrerythraea TaxID=28229 RepID=A0A099KW37_COLPS|nr:EAL domain-containing protein [Colwellia psychrerythraea]KGJ93868.1 diguanylate phosphodiesterase [Colwellia psychrerythraea]